MGSRHRALAQVVADVHEAPWRPGEWVEKMNAVTDFVGADATHLFVAHRQTGRSPFGTGGRAPGDTHEWYMREYQRDDVRFSRALPLPRGRISAHAHMSSRAVRRCPVHNAFLRKLDRYWLAGRVDTFDSDHALFLSALRSREKGEFEESELSALDAVYPHLRLAARLHMQLATVQGSHHALEAALDRSGAAWFFVDASARMVTVTAAAEAMLARGDVVYAEGPCLRVHGPREDRLLRSTLHAIGRSPLGSAEPAGGRMVLSAGTRRGRAVAGVPVCVAPLPGSEAVEMGSGRAVAAILVPVDGREETPSAEQLALAFGLTSGLAEVAARLAAGHRTEQVATGMGITVSSARTLVKRLLAETGVHSQAQLVRLFLQSIPRVRPQA